MLLLPKTKRPQKIIQPATYLLLEHSVIQKCQPNNSFIPSPLVEAIHAMVDSLRKEDDLEHCLEISEGRLEKLKETI